MFIILAVLSLIMITAVWLIYWYRKPFLEDVHQKCVFITGTDSGIGRQLALDLDSKGLRVYAGCLTKEGGQSLESGASQRLRVIRIDVTRLDSIEEAKKAIERDLSPGQGLWGLVNNAGIAKGSIFGLTTLDDFRQVMEVNFFGVVAVTDIFSPLLKKSHGRIVNIISCLGRVSLVTEPYCCSKFALQPYTDGLRRWMRMYGIHVVAVEPGFMPTRMTQTSNFEEVIVAGWNRLPKHLQEEYGHGIVEQAKKYFEDIFMRFNMFRSWNSVSLATDAITHALLAKHPKDRYIVGYDSFILGRFVAFLPDWLMDFFVYHAFTILPYLQRRNLSKPQSANAPISFQNSNATVMK